MDNKFKFDMLITSFVPLWISIIITVIWSIVENGIESWIQEESIARNLVKVCKMNLEFIIAAFLIFVLMVASIKSIDTFLNDKKGNGNSPKIKIKSVVKANKLSSEFLLAYILPMFAFDFTKLKDWALFAIYFATLAFLSIRNNNVYTNIWLEVKGYKMYFCNLETKRMGKRYTYSSCLVISKNDSAIKLDNEMRYWDFDNYIYIDLD